MRTLCSLRAGALSLVLVGLGCPGIYTQESKGVPVGEDPGESVARAARDLALEPHIQVARTRTRESGMTGVTVSFQEKMGYRLGDLMRFLELIEKGGGRVHVDRFDFGRPDKANEAIWRPSSVGVVTRPSASGTEAARGSALERLRRFLSAFDSVKSGKDTLVSLTGDSTEIRFEVRGTLDIFDRLAPACARLTDFRELIKGSSSTDALGTTRHENCRLLFTNGAKIPAVDPAQAVVKVANSLRISSKIAISAPVHVPAGKTRVSVQFLNMEGYQFRDLIRLMGLIEQEGPGLRIASMNLGERDPGPGNPTWRPISMDVEGAGPDAPSQASALDRIKTFVALLEKNRSELGTYTLDRLQANGERILWTMSLKESGLEKLQNALASLPGYRQFSRGKVRTENGFSTCENCQIEFVQ